MDKERDMAWSRSKWTAVLLDVGERAGWSAGQVLFATLLAGGTAVAIGDLPWKLSLTLAGSAALASVVLTAGQYVAKLTNMPFWADLLARLLKTFLSSMAASFLADHPFNVTTFHWTTALNLAAVATITALGKGFLASGHSVAAPGGPAGPAAAGQPPAPPAPLQRTPSTLTTTTYLHAIR